MYAALRLQLCASEFPHDNPRLGRFTYWIGGAPLTLGDEREDPPDEQELPHTDVECAAEPVAVEEPELPHTDVECAAEPVAVGEPELPHTDVECAAEPVAVGEPGEPELPQTDAFTLFLDVACNVARAHAGADAEAHARALLAEGRLATGPMSAEAEIALAEARVVERCGTEIRTTPSFEATARAWARALRGESSDLSSCGESTLDTWSADLIARLAGATARTRTIRSELRRHGVAAFGMLETAH